MLSLKEKFIYLIKFSIKSEIWFKRLISDEINVIISGLPPKPFEIIQLIR